MKSIVERARDIVAEQKKQYELNHCMRGEWITLGEYAQAVIDLAEALELITARDGMCIFGTYELAETREKAFRQGSSFAYQECVEEAREVLKKWGVEK